MVNCKPSMSRLFTCILLGLLAISVGCSDRDAPQKITMWHQMLVGERVVLQELIDEYNESQLEKPKEDRVEVTALYKETEELRSSFQAAVLAGTGPDLVFGPSDAVGAFVAMGIVKDMRPWFNQWGDRDDFLEAGLT